MKLYGKSFALLLILALSLTLTACSAGGQGDSAEEITTLIYANLTEGGVDRGAVEKFNRTHTDVQIEVRDYFDEEGSDGKERLFTEIAAGKMPDIIDMGNSLTRSHRLPYQMMVHKGLLENLWPYIENDPELGRESVVEAPLKAAEVNGGLYVAFNCVSMLSLAGAESMVGNRYSWTLEELQEAFVAMPEGSTVLEYFLSKEGMFYSLFGMSIDSYVDWKTGECSFTGEGFKSMLEFLYHLPDESEVGVINDYVDVNEEATSRLMHGYQMLGTICIAWPAEIQFFDAYYGLGGRAAFVGFPMEDGEVGSSFEIKGPRLAMSSACKNKDAAWDFIRQIFLPQYKTVEIMEKRQQFGFPINRADYDLMTELDMDIGRNETRALMDGPMVEFRKATAEEFQRYEDFINHINKIDLFDNEILNIAQELAGAYFSGDKTLDETVALIQNRVTLYVNENR